MNGNGSEGLVLRPSAEWPAEAAHRVARLSLVFRPTQGRFALSRIAVAALQHKVSVLQKQMQLQLRINSLTSQQMRNLEAQIVSLQNQPTTLQTTVQFAFGSTDANGAASATAFCPGTKVVGGGAQFVGQAYISDHVLYSLPNIAGTSWSAAADGAFEGRQLEVYAVCAAVG